MVDIDNIYGMNEGKTEGTVRTEIHGQNIHSDINKLY